MSKLPLGWSKASLEELSGIGGLVTDGDWIESKDQDPRGQVRLIQLQDIGDGAFLNKSRRFLTLEAAERLRCSFLEEGDLLIARMPDPLGRACVFPGLDQKCVTAVDVCIWRAGQFAADPRWLVNAINAPTIRTDLLSKAGGTTRQRISGGNLKKTIIPVPPLSEQSRIEAKLCKLFDHSKRAHRELGPVPLLVQNYKRAVLASAFSGEITEDWRTRKRVSRCAHVELAKVVSQFDYGSSTKSSASGDVPVLRMGNIQDGELDWSKLVFTSNKTEIAKYALESGDVLFNRTNSPELVGKTAIYRGGRPAIFAGYLIRMKCSDSLRPAYLTYCLNSPEGRDYCWSVKSDGVNQSNINAKKLAAFSLPLPSIEEQDEIIRRVSSALKRVAVFDAEQIRAQQLLYHMEAAILERALNGDLVDQNSTEESAAVFLQRIRSRRRYDHVTPTSRIQKSSRAQEVKRTLKGEKMGRRRSEVGLDHLKNTLVDLGGSAKAKKLWQQSGMDIEEFYKQLRHEIKAGGIRESAQKDELVATDAP